MATSVSITPIYVTDLDESADFYRTHFGLEAGDDVTFGPEMRWLTLTCPGDGHRLLLALIDHHVPPADRDAMRQLVTKGVLPVFLIVDDVDATFEQLRAAGAEVLQEPMDQAYGMRDAAVRDPSGNHLRMAQLKGESAFV